MLTKYEEIVNDLQNKGYRLTEIRKAVIKILTEKEHMEMSEIISVLKKNNKNVNIMSIYNTIDLLSNEHVIHANVVANTKVFELSDNIIHVICNICRKIIYETKGQQAADFLSLQKISNFLSNKNKFKISHFDLEIHGICENCQNKS